MALNDAGRDRYLEAHRYVRLLALVPAVWLLGSIATLGWSQGIIYPSISDYYGGPLRDVFVGGLMAAGVLMVTYKGESQVEDYALNFAGFNALLVALVPNSFPSLLAAASAAPVLPGVAPTGPDELLANMRLIVGALLVVTFGFIALDWRMMDWRHWIGGERPRWARRLLTIMSGAEAGFIVMLFAMFTRETIGGCSIFTVIHFSAAVLLIANLSIAAASHAFPKHLRTAADAPSPSRYAQRGFLCVTLAMWIGMLVGAVAIFAGVKNATFWTEVGQIALFAVFWAVATRNDWGDRRDLTVTR